MSQISFHGYWSCLCVLSIVSSAGAATITSDYLFVNTMDTVTATGSAATMELLSPWNTQLAVEPIGADSITRYFAGKLYVVNRGRGTVQVIDACTLATDLEFNVDAGPVAGNGPDPQDIMVVSPTVAYVTRRNRTHLYRVDPTTGIGEDVIDLSVYADGDGLPEMSMMARDGDFLFIQVQREDRVSGQQGSGYLAVVDLVRGRLIRRRFSPGDLPGVALLGRNPSFKMQVDSAARRLYVSTPGDRNDFTFGDTGVEAVDLDHLQSLGFAISENQLGADVSAFVIVSPTKGYCIAHTDIVASSHLRVFEPFVGQTGELIVTLDNIVESLAYDAGTSQLFFPDASQVTGLLAVTSGGIRVYDTNTETELTTGALSIGGFPLDLTIVPAQP